MPNDLFIMHYGVGHDKGGHSGRYPWGSGDQPYGETHGKKKVTKRALNKLGRQNNKVYNDMVDQFNKDVKESGLTKGTHSIYRNPSINKLGEKLMKELRDSDLVKKDDGSYNARSSEKIVKEMRRLARTNADIKKLVKKASDTYIDNGLKYVDKFYDKYDVKDLYDDPKKRSLLKDHDSMPDKWIKAKYNRSAVSNDINNYIYDAVGDMIFNKYFYQAYGVKQK